MSRHRCLRRSMVTTCVLALAAGTVVAADKPNILFIFTDDHALQAISAYGSRINQTPHIDSIATAGVRFDNCFVGNSICGPSRATVLTGKYSHANGVYHNRNKLNADQPLVTRMLQEAGYATAIIGKWHLQIDPPGFDYSEVLIDQGTYYNSPMIRNGKQVEYTGYTTNVITDRVLDWLETGRDKGKPFFLMYQHKTPHRPFDPAPEHFHMFENMTIPEPPLLFEDDSLRGTAARQSDMLIRETMDERDLKLIPPRELNEEQLAKWNAFYGARNARFRELGLTGEALVRWKYQQFIKDYLRCVAALDDNVGRALRYLDESGLAKNTVVIYVSDQGFYLGEHGWFDKRWMYEHSLRTPLMIRWPGVAKAGTFCDAIVSNLDFAPTFLEIAGAATPADMHGRSLVPILKGEKPTDWRTSFYYHYYEFPAWHFVRKHYGVTDTRFKLIHFYEKDVNEWELYDLKFDPFELTNLYKNPTYAGVKDKMFAELQCLRKQLAVPEIDPAESMMGSFSPRTRPRTVSREP
ncbi:MAG: sulfatase [Phycisphaerae bacterium]